MAAKMALARAKSALMPRLPRSLPVDSGGLITTAARSIHGCRRRFLLPFVSHRWVSEWRDPLRGFNAMLPSSCPYAILHLPGGNPTPAAPAVKKEVSFADETEEGEGLSEGWEEEDEVESQLDDGGDGGGVVLGDVAWGGQVLSIANEVLDLHFDGDIRLFAFKVSPKEGYIHVRLDKLSDKYGCPSFEEIKNSRVLYKQQLEKSGECGKIPTYLALEVTTPGLGQILRVPDDLDRFKEMPMVVNYLGEDLESQKQEEKVRKSSYWNPSTWKLVIACGSWLTSKKTEILFVDESYIGSKRIGD